MNEKEALKLSLEVFEYPGNIWHMDCPKDKAIAAIREALALSESSTECEETSHAQPEQDPPPGTISTTITTTPQPKRTWVGLTDEEIWENDSYKVAITDQETRWLYRFARAIEAKLKEKNT